MENEHPIKDFLRQMIAERKWDRRLHEVRIREFWSSKMGTTINRHTTELKLRRNKLYLSFDSAAIRQDMLYKKEDIKQAINRLLGEEVITDVVIR